MKSIAAWASIWGLVLAQAPAPLPAERPFKIIRLDPALDDIIASNA